MVKKKVIPRKSFEIGTVVSKTYSTPYLPNFVLQGASVETSHGTPERSSLRANIDGMKEKKQAEKGTNQEKEEKHIDDEWKPKKRSLATFENGDEPREPEKELNVRESRREDKGEKHKEKSKLKHHPLADYVNLSELQVIITEALIYHGEPCSFEKLNDFVSTEIRERDIRRKDGTPYAADCRRAIQANLRITSNHLLALYKKDVNGMWSLCHTVEEAKKVASTESAQESLNINTNGEKKSVRLINSRDKAANNNSEPNDMDPEQLAAYWDPDDSIPGPFTRTRAQEKTFKSITTPNSTPMSVYKEEERDELSLLQKFVSLFIISFSDISSIDNMEAEARLVWPVQYHNIARKSIVMVLVNQTPPILFMRNPENFSNWQLNEAHQWYDLPSEEIEKKRAAIYRNIATAKRSELTVDNLDDFNSSYLHHSSHAYHHS
jgi:hypothetical protein